MDQIAIALVLIAIGMMAAATAWFGRNAGIKAIILLIIASAVGVAGGFWMLWP